MNVKEKKFVKRVPKKNTARVRWQKKSKRMRVNGWRTSHSAIHKVKFLNKSASQTSTLFFPLRYALHADPWLVVQTLLASSGQSEINVDDSNHAV
jgi:hypothetical protein